MTDGFEWHECSSFGTLMTESSRSACPPLLAKEMLGLDGVGCSSLPHSMLFPTVLSFKNWICGGFVVFNAQLLFLPAVKWLFFLTEEIHDI